MLNNGEVIYPLLKEAHVMIRGFPVAHEACCGKPNCVCACDSLACIFAIFFMLKRRFSEPGKPLKPGEVF
jgi:hypothetical protein